VAWPPPSHVRTQVCSQRCLAYKGHQYVPSDGHSERVMVCGVSRCVDEGSNAAMCILPLRGWLPTTTCQQIAAWLMLTCTLAGTWPTRDVCQAIAVVQWPRLASVAVRHCCLCSATGCKSVEKMLPFWPNRRPNSWSHTEPALHVCFSVDGSHAVSLDAGQCCWYPQPTGQCWPTLAN
jgi:hypothetical protein